MFYNNQLYKEDLLNCIENNDFTNLKNTNILITGASGMIGSLIVDTLLYSNTLLNLNINVYALGRNKTTLEKRFLSNINNPKLSFIIKDINSALTTNINFDYIIHAASNAYPCAFSIDPVGTMMTNINGVNNLLDYGKTHNLKKFLFVSSGEVYGQGDTEVKAFDENYYGYVDITNPRACYPNGKRAAETLCISYYNQYGLKTVIARPSHTYGATATKKDNRAATQFINNIINDENIVMKSNGLQLRSYCYVADCVSALFTILLKGNEGCAYNIANNKSNVTIREIAQTLTTLYNKKIIFENPSDIELKSFNPVSQSVLDATKIENLGWRAKYNIEEGLKRTVTILKEI